MDRKTLKLLSMFTHLGYIMVTPIIVGIVGANFLDNWLHTEPFILIIGVISGVAAAFKNLYMYMEKFNK